VYLPLFWLMQILHVDVNFNVNFYLVRYLITFFAVGLPSAMAGGLLYSLCYLISQSRWRSYVVTLAIALGTMIFPFSTVLFGHSLAAALLFIGFFMIFQMKLAAPRYGVGYLIMIGLVLGFAFMAEYTAAVVVVLLTAYYLYVLKNYEYGLRPSWILAPLFGGLAPISLYLAYNWLCFGSPFSNAYSHLALKQMQELHGHGLLGVDWPKLSTLYYITLHPVRGLFVQSPVLLIAIVGFIFMGKARIWRVECALAAFALLAYLLINSGLTLWWGGHSFGPRYLIPILPFMCLPLIFIPKRLLPILLILTIISMLHMFIATVGNPLVPDRQIWRLLEEGVAWFPYFGYSPIYGDALDLVVQGQYAHNLGMLLGLSGSASLLPLAIILLYVSAKFAVRANQAVEHKDSPY